MKAKRRRYEPVFKARVAIEALKGIKTIQQIAKDYDIPPHHSQNPGGDFLGVAFWLALFLEPKPKGTRHSR